MADLATPLPPRLAAWHRGEHLDLLGGLNLLTDTALPDLPSPAARTPDLDRRAVAAGLAEANTRYGHPRAEALAERLADPATRVVITGQQPGLFGGPLYSLLKMLGAVLWAEALDAAGTPAIPLFWVATEDHDFTEVAQATFWLREPLPLALEDDGMDLIPVGDRPLGASLPALFERLRAEFGWGSFLGGLDRLAAIYQPHATFGEAFMAYAVALLGERAPLCVDSQLPAVKRAQQPLLRRLVEERVEIADRLQGREDAIERAGFDLQVSSQPEAAPLLAIAADGTRRRVVWVGDHGYSLRGHEAVLPVDALLELIEQDPRRLTPNVLARPVLQDAIFGTGLQVLGPGELSYFAQAEPLYAHLGVPAPHVVLRPQALLFDSRQTERWEAMGLDPELLVADESTVDKALAERSETPQVDRVRERIEAELVALRGPSLALDPNLERPWEKTRDAMVQALERFAERVTRSAGQRDTVLRGRLDALRDYAAPGGTLHERVLSTAYFHGRFGDALVSQLLARLSRQPGRLQLLTLEADDGS